MSEGLTYSDLSTEFIAQGRAAAAASSLIAKLQAPPRAHAIWVQAKVDPDGNIKHVICVARHPKWGAGLKIPETHDGFDVQEVAWPS